MGIVGDKSQHANEMLNKQELNLLIAALKLVKKFRMCFNPAEKLNVQIDELVKKLNCWGAAKEVSPTEAVDIVMGFLSMDKEE